MDGSNNLNTPLNQGAPMTQPGMPVGQPMMQPPVGQQQMGQQQMGQPQMMPPQMGQPMGQINYFKKIKPVKNLPGSFKKFHGGFLSDLLEDIRGIFIRQKTDWQEAMIGIAREQVFLIHDIDDNSGQLLLRCKEKSDCCARTCMRGSCRPFHMKIVNKIDETVCLWIEREFSCTCCCLNRPSAKIYVFDDNHQRLYLGEIKDVFRCCEYKFEVKDDEDKVIYNLDTPMCQTALCCQFPCDDCNMVDFKVCDANNQPISLAKKRGKGCMKNALTTASNFNIMFTPQMPWNHRALLMCSILFLDYRMFEDKNNDGRRNNDY